MRLFLTGAGGLLGGAVAEALLDAGHAVVALVRSSRQVIDMDGRDRADAVTLVTGDIGEAHCRLAELPQGIDAVVHCAAVTDFDAPPDVHRRINIDGALNVAALAKSLGAPMLHVSTAYVCGTRDGVIAEDAVAPDTRFNNGYEASKASAETALRQLDQPIAIVRPSVILGRYSDGAIAAMDTFYAMFKLVGSGTVGAIPVANGAGFNFVPIDHVAAAILHICEKLESFAGQVVHLTAPANVSMADLVAAIRHYPGASPSPLVPPEAFDASLLDRRQALIQRKIGRMYFGYFQRSPQFVSAALQTGGGPVCPDMDAAAMLRMIDYCVATGFVDWGSRHRTSG